MDAPPWRRRATPAAPRDVAAPRFIGDRAMIELRQRLALEPDAVPQPVDLNAGASVDRLALRVGAVVAVAALVAWGVASFSHARLPGHVARQARVVAAIAAAKIKPGPAPTPAVAAAPAPIETPAVAQVVFAAEEKAPAWASVVPLPLPFQQPAGSIAAKTPEPAPPAASSSPVASPRALAADEIDTLVKRGHAFMTDGDIAAARLLLQRAAEAGSADAALALGASFDPVLIKKARAIGVQTDAAQARYWYQKAAALGSEVAAKQLAKLASAGQ